MAGYLIKYGDDVLFQPGDPDRPAHSARLSMRTDDVSTLDLTIPPGHVMWGSDALMVHDFDNPVRVWFDGELLFQGFIARISESINTEKTLHCESELAWLSWLHIRIDDHPQGNGNRRVYTAPQLFQKCVDFYNYYLEDDQQDRAFTIGHTLGAADVGYYDEEAGKTCVDGAASTPTTILDLLKKAILDPYNCMLRVWYGSGGTRYIGLYTSAPTTSTQTITFGENMTEFTSDLDTSELYTGCIPIGGSVRTYNREHDQWFQLMGDVARKGKKLRLRSAMGYAFTVTKGDIVAVPVTGLNQGGYTYQVKSDSVTLPTSGYAEVTIEDGAVSAIPAIDPRSGDNTIGYAVPRGTDYETSTLTLSRMIGGWWDADHEWYKDGDIVYRPASVALHGLKTFTFTDSDILVPEDLIRKAISELQERLFPTFTLSVSGVDMALYMPGYTHLLAGQKVRVVSDPHGVDVIMQVNAADLDLDDPGATTYTIGPVPATATGRIKANAMDTNDVRDMLTYDVNDVVTGAQIMGLT